MHYVLDWQKMTVCMLRVWGLCPRPMHFGCIFTEFGDRKKKKKKKKKTLWGFGLARTLGKYCRNRMKIKSSRLVLMPTCMHRHTQLKVMNDRYTLLFLVRHLTDENIRASFSYHPSLLSHTVLCKPETCFWPT